MTRLGGSRYLMPMNRHYLSTSHTGESDQHPDLPYPVHPDRNLPNNHGLRNVRPNDLLTLTDRLMDEHHIHPKPPGAEKKD